MISRKSCNCKMLLGLIISTITQWHSLLFQVQEQIYQKSTLTEPLTKQLPYSFSFVAVFTVLFFRCIT